MPRKEEKKEEGMEMKWAELARSLSTDGLTMTVPVRTVVKEAEAAARFLEKNWATISDPATKVTQRGLESAGKRLPKTLATEIRELIPIIVAANYDYEVTVDPKSTTADSVARGREIVDEIAASLEWLFDDGVDDKNDADLAAIEAAHQDDPVTADAVALALEDYARLATPHVKELDGLGGFDPAILDEAKKVAETLRAAPVVLGFTPSPASHAAMGIRNRYLQLLQDRVDRIRKAARFVYRDDPAVAAGAMSTYAKRRNAIAKRLAARKTKHEGPNGAQPQEVAPQ